jgi:hypothetical protein
MPNAIWSHPQCCFPILPPEKPVWGECQGEGSNLKIFSLFNTGIRDTEHLCYNVIGTLPTSYAHPCPSPLPHPPFEGCVPIVFWRYCVIKFPCGWLHSPVVWRRDVDEAELFLIVSREQIRSRAPLVFSRTWHRYRPGVIMDTHNPFRVKYTSEARSSVHIYSRHAI